MRKNTSITQNNMTAPGTVEARFPGNIDACVDGRWSDIQAHVMSAKGIGGDTISSEERIKFPRWKLVVFNMWLSMFGYQLFPASNNGIVAFTTTKPAFSATV